MKGVLQPFITFHSPFIHPSFTLHYCHSHVPSFYHEDVRRLIPMAELLSLLDRAITHSFRLFNA